MAETTDRLAYVGPPVLAALCADVLDQGACLRVRIGGHSMWPFMHNGDTLIAARLNLVDVRMGDIVLANAGHWVLAHRLVARRELGGHTVLITKGDRVRHCDPPWTPEQVLGVVVAVERNGRRRWLRQGRWRVIGALWARISYRILPAALGVLSRARRLSSRLLGWVQSPPQYRALARSLHGGPVIYGHAEGSDEPALCRLFRVPSLGGLNGAAAEASGRHILVARYASQVVGAAIVHREPGEAQGSDVWWLSSLVVKPAYRRLGIGEGLTRQAMALAAAQRAQEIHLVVFQGNPPALRLFEKLSFQPVPMPVHAEHRRLAAGRASSRRIVLRRGLP